MLKTVAVSVTPWRHSSVARPCPSSPFPMCPRSNPRARRLVAADPRHGSARRVIRRASAALVLAVALAASATLAVAPVTAQAAPRLDGTERTVIKLINSYRARHGRARLRASGRLNRAADRHSREMLAHDFFAHASRNGTPATTRVRRSSRARSVGENIAFIGSGQRRMARLVVSMWIDSAKHREVLLHPSFRRIGVGGRAGDLSGNRGNAITADFASRR